MTATCEHLNQLRRSWGRVAAVAFIVVIRVITPHQAQEQWLPAPESAGVMEQEPSLFEIERAKRARASSPGWPCRFLSWRPWLADYQLVGFDLGPGRRGGSPVATQIGMTGVSLAACRRAERRRGSCPQRHCIPDQHAQQPPRHRLIVVPSYAQLGLHTATTRARACICMLFHRRERRYGWGEVKKGLAAGQSRSSRCHLAFEQRPSLFIAKSEAYATRKSELLSSGLFRAPLDTLRLPKWRRAVKRIF